MDAQSSGNLTVIQKDDGSQHAGGSRAGVSREMPTGCNACGLERQNMHRLKRDGALRTYCSPCVLFHHKGLYCCQCFQVTLDHSQLGDPALIWLTCSNCQRLTHIHCAQNRGLPTDSFSFACRYCYKEDAVEGLEGISSGPDQLHGSNEDCSFSLSDQETLAAGTIVAGLAAVKAKEFKGRARAYAAMAARAARLAKAALDVAYRTGLEELRWRAGVSNQTTIAAPMAQQAGQMAIHINGVTGNHLTVTPLSDKLLLQQRILEKNPQECQAAGTIRSHYKRRVLPPVVSGVKTGISLTALNEESAVQKQGQPQSPQAAQQHASSTRPLQPASCFKGPAGEQQQQQQQHLVMGSGGLVFGTSSQSLSENSSVLGASQVGSSTEPQHNHASFGKTIKKVSACIKVPSVAYPGLEHDMAEGSRQTVHLLDINGLPKGPNQGIPDNTVDDVKDSSRWG